MFEKYTEKVRRAIFFARYEASLFGSSQIEAEHLLLGLLREDRALGVRFFRGGITIETIRKQVEARTEPREKIPTSIDLPLSAESKRVLAYANEEAERVSHKWIGTEHMLAGLLREEKSFVAELLRERAVSLEKVREELSKAKHESGEVAPVKRVPLVAEFSQDLTEEARSGRVDPLIGRENEMERMVETLSRRSRRNPVLVGEPGVGKAALVKGLAQRITEGNVPPPLESKRIIALQLSSLLAGTRRSEERLKAVLAELAQESDLIVFVEELFVPAGREELLDAANAIRPPIARGDIQCIVSATPADYSSAAGKEPWVSRYFHPISVPPPDEASAIKILFGIRDRYEKFHGVTYTDEALEYAVRYSTRYVPSRYLPDKAIDIIDEAGACLKVRQQRPPDEVLEAEKRCRFIERRMQASNANQEFEKARFYHDELRRENENLETLKESFGSGDPGKANVTRNDIEAVVARWTGIPVSEIASGPSA